jgi:hypothetical protein
MWEIIQIYLQILIGGLILGIFVWGSDYLSDKKLKSKIISKKQCPKD